jgi:hypothetical protein
MSSSSFSDAFWAFSCSDELFTLHGTAITTRHVALLIVTWMLARIAEVVHNILLATQETGAKDAAAASMPVQVGEPTFKAGGSVPMKPEGSQVGHSWTPMEAKNFRVRCGPNYKKNGLKAPSGPALGKVEAMDVFITERRIRHCLSLGHIALPPATPGWSEVYPEFLVITQMLPVHFNSALVAGKGADGETYVLITYVRMPPNLGAGYRSDDEPQNAEQLLKRFLMRADQDPGVAHCWKMIGVGLNLQEIGRQLPGSIMRLLTKYNGKPVLSRPQHEFFRDPQNRYLQADLNGHEYNYGTRTAVNAILKHSTTMEVGYGYVVEARKEPEMPEVMACCCRINKFNLSEAIPFPPKA